jgi:hypothetical protein
MNKRDSKRGRLPCIGGGQEHLIVEDSLISKKVKKITKADAEINRVPLLNFRGFWFFIKRI